MLKDKLKEAVKTSLNSINNGGDYVPLGMRGELEVIVKDRDGNVLSYERDHNQVTKLAKMAIVHLLAGEIGAVDDTLYSIAETGSASMQRTYSLTSSTNAATIVPKFTPGNHTSTQNLDGQLVSDEQYFYTGSDYVVETSTVNQLSQVQPLDVSATAINFNFPTKMLFGTGVEGHDTTSMETSYNDDFGEVPDASVINKLNGYTTATTIEDETFFAGCSKTVNSSVLGSDLSVSDLLSNWYSNSAYRCRTLQPASTSALSRNPSSTDTAISGAIKNCFITDTTSSAGFYNPTTKMAYPAYRGCGYPCFIYAKRSTGSFYNTATGNDETYYQMNSSLSNSGYETELTYTVTMPAQPTSLTSITTFYPYNGWVLKQAGLFCDARFRLKTMDDDTSSGYSETEFLNEVSDISSSDNVAMYRDSVGGQMLFTRNLSSPILKTADDEVTFVWHIFITV